MRRAFCSKCGKFTYQTFKQLETPEGKRIGGEKAIAEQRKAGAVLYAYRCERCGAKITEEA